MPKIEVSLIIEAALLASSDYINDNIEAICDEDYLTESEEILAQVNEALDLLRHMVANHES